MVKTDFLERAVRTAFQKYSALLCRYRVVLLLFPLICSALFGIGFLSLSFHTDTEYLFTPQNSQAAIDRRLATELFPVDYDNVTLNRLTEANQRQVSVIVTATDGGNVLTGEAMEEIARLDSLLKNITIRNGEDPQEANYSILCARWDDTCVGNDVLKYYIYQKSITSNTTIDFTYPYGVVSPTEVLFMEPFLGGARVVNNNRYASAKAVLLIYLLRNNPPELNHLSEEWEDLALDASANFESSLVNGSMLSSDSLDETQKTVVEQVLPNLYAMCATLALFAVLTCLMLQDAVQSKPLLGLLGVLTPCLAILSVFGLLSAIGIEFNSVVLSTPFLVIGIGLDNMFVMLAAWRRTSPLLPVETRVRDTYTEAAVSITITSVTDCLAFCIGAITPLPAIRIFCLFTALAIVFNFIYHITFWGSCLVMFGHLEAQNRHSLMFRRVIPGDSTRSAKFRINCCSGGLPKSEFSIEEGKEVEDCKHSMMIFFRDHYASLLVKRPVMIVTVVCYLVYLAVAIAGCTLVKLGLKSRHLSFEGSETYNFLSQKSEHFNTFGSSVSVMIPDPLPYWNMTVQLEDMLRDFHFSDYIKPKNYTQCWFSDFKDRDESSPSDGEEYIKLLRENFLTDPRFSRYRLDINFDDKYLIINSSRCILSTNYQSDANEAVSMMKELRDIASNHSTILGYPVTLYSSDFIFFEQFAIIVPVTLQTVSIAMASMMLVALLLIPHPVVSCLVTLSVASTMTGVVGFMTFWDVALNSLTMITLILSVGFSVDFSAHMAYSFVVNQASRDPYTRLSESLHALGYPILQCGISTILSVCLLLFTPSYVYQAFAKILILVTGFGIMHGLIILPMAMWMYTYYNTNSTTTNRVEQEQMTQQPEQEPLEIGLSTQRSTTI